MNHKIIKLCGFDPSLRNWGIATASLNLSTNQLVIDGIQVISPVLDKSKSIRVNSLDLQSASELYTKAYDPVKSTQIVFAEVPVGSQSSRAMAGYGICIGVLGSLRSNGVHIHEVTPTEVKLASVGSKTATKKQMINWAVNKHPEANWPMYKKGGVSTICEAQAEHMADAIATIYAGMLTNQFKQLISFTQNY